MNMQSSTNRNFDTWARTISQRTNRSLAGARVHINASSDPEMLTAMGQWGMITQDDQRQADFDATVNPTSFIDATKLDGKAAIDYAQLHMPVVKLVTQQLQDTRLLHNVRIAVCLVLEPKTAVLLRTLQRLGARIGVFAGPDETDQRVADQLRAEGIIVEANRNFTPEETHMAALRLLDTLHPDIIIDDGASFTRLAVLERPHLAANLIGVAEETTSGVRAFEAMQQAGTLSIPVVAANDSVLKTGFDNRHGTGETCVTTMQTILGDSVFTNAHVTVIGYGPVGKGFALRVRALGARVTICEANPTVALQAVFDGFNVQDLSSVLSTSQIVVSATGVRHTISLEHLQRMQEATIVSVIGGIANEIALDDIPDFHKTVGEQLTPLHVPQGPTVRLISQGDGVNYTAGGGNPIEIMDLSFAVQLHAVVYLLQHRQHLRPGIHRLGDDVDQQIALLALQARGFRASQPAEHNGYHWKMTRFQEELSTHDSPSNTPVKE